MRTLSLLWLMACQAEPEVVLDTAEHGGERLSLMRQESDDGVGFSYGFWDNELDLACDFRVAEDGELRCLPLPLSQASTHDPGCEDRWVVQPSCPDAETPHVVERVADHWVVFEGESTSDVCPSNQGAAVVAPGSSVPPERFVRGAWFDDSASDIGLRTVVSTDGARRMVSLLAEGVPCEPRSFEDGTWRCVPNPVDPLGYYADPDCTELLYVSTDPVPVGSWIMAERPGEMEASRTTEPSWPVDSLYYRLSHSCVKFDFTRRHAVRPGGRAHASSLPEVAVGWLPDASPSVRTVSAGHGLLHLAGVSVTPSWSLLDDGWDRCAPYESDGELVCQSLLSETKALLPQDVRATCPSLHTQGVGSEIRGPRLHHTRR